MLKTYKLRDICSVSKGTQINTSLLKDGNPYKYINGGVKESGYFTDYNTEGNTILISEGGSCGYVSFLNERAWIGCHCYRLHNLDFDSKYLYWALKANQNNLENLKTGAAIQNIKKADLYEYEILLSPDETQQQRITSILNGIEKVICLLTKEIGEFDELLKSRFIEMLGKNAKTGIAYSLGNLCSVGSSKRVYQEELLHDGIPFLRISDLNCLIDKVAFEPESYISKQKYNQLVSEKMVPTEGDLLITSRGTLGRCYVVQPDDNFYFQDGMISWLYDFADNVRADYIAFLFQKGLFDDQISDMQLGATVSYLSIRMIKALLVEVPSLDRQDEFISFLHQVDKSKYQQ